MDLVITLSQKVERLPEGAHTPGVRAIQKHVQTAFAHLRRGQDAVDETAFNDVVYRCNQAFEGSVKEAYRVLADKDPSHLKLYSIENYLSKQRIFADRVLQQFKRYRDEWRNPSTHDYALEFNEQEAFLAVVNVAAFAVLLLNQITEKLAFDSTQELARAQGLPTAGSRRPSEELIDDLVPILLDFCRRMSSGDLPQEATVSGSAGAVHGYISLLAPDTNVVVEPLLAAGRRERVDLVVSRGSSRVIIELKRRFDPRYMQNVIAQVEHYMLVGDVNRAIILYLPHQEAEVMTREVQVPAISGRLIVIGPERSNPTFKPTPQSGAA